MAGNESQEVPALDAHIAHVQELVFPFASAIPRTPTGMRMYVCVF